MSYFVAGILRIILLEASAALLVMERLIDPGARLLQARRRLATLAVAALSLFAFSNFGELHGGGRLVHPWEQYHFFLGSKYLPEIGYFDLYKATLLADREGAHALRVERTRDLHDFELVPVDAALADAARVRARFTDARWEAFKADWARLSDWPAPWSDVVSDHGNSGSPAWALVALPFVELCGSSPLGQQLLGCLDLALMLALGILLACAFGAEAAAVGITVFALTPFSFDYLGGSILRWDWLFALGMALYFLKRERPLPAGAFLGYAIVSKLFPLLFAVALGAWLLADSWRKKRLHPYVPRLAAGAALSAALFVAASSLAFGGPSIWRGYQERIQVAQVEKYYPNQYSLKTVFLQLAETTPQNLLKTLFKPAVIKQSLPAVAADAHHTGLLLARLALTLLALFAITRVDLLEAFAVGPFLVLIWLTVNAYYWNMLGLTALVLARPRQRGLSAPLLGLHATWAAYCLYQHLDWRFAEGYFVALLLLATFAAWAIQSVRPAAPAR